jgi:hypothetical protein
MPSCPNRRALFSALMLPVIALLFAACASTTVENDMAARGVTKLHFKKIVVISSTENAKVRRDAEDAFVSQIRRAECVPSYRLLPAEADLNDVAKIKAAVKASGADGAVVLRMLSFQWESTVKEGKTYDYASYSGYAGYYGGYYGGYAGYVGDGTVTVRTHQNDDTVSNTKVLQIDSRIYDVATERMVWSGRVISNNPKNPRQVIVDAVKAVRERMEADGLIPKAE